ncbi:MAG: hypothetical protein ACXAEJ_07425 [Candidatus Thorarchaeota archaeon]|jgi:hypothetical protein
MSDGCTIGAKFLSGRVFLLKNRDLVYEDFKDAAIFDDEIFAVQGVKIGSAEPCGVSIGVSRKGLMGCSSTVLANLNTAYDLLLEDILRKVNTIEDAYKLVTDSLDQGNEYQWCNFVFADTIQVGVIEIGHRESQMETDPTCITRANHHVLLPTSEMMKKASPEEREAGGPLHTSQERRQTASKMLKEAVSIADMIQILGSHREGRGFDSICRHRSHERGNPFLGETSYSYIIEAFSEKAGFKDIRFHVARGNPCSNTFFEFKIDFGMPIEEKIRLVQEFP